MESVYLIVDLDGTLIDKKNNATYRLLYEYFRKKGMYLQMMKLIFDSIKLSIDRRLFRNHEIMSLIEENTLTAIIRGIDYDDFREFSESFAKSLPIRDEVLNLIGRIESDFHVKGKVILTGSFQCVADVVARRLDFDMAFGSKLRVKNGTVVGFVKKYYGDTKFSVIEENSLVPYVYITDDKSEKKLFENSIKWYVV